MKAQAREILDQYLESNLHRKTPERYAILDAVFSMRGHFTLEELGAALERKNFRVSRATLYNTIHLFLELRLVVRHSLVDGTKYEASSSNENHVHQVCTVCGRVTEVQAPLVTAAINETRLSGSARTPSCSTSMVYAASVRQRLRDSATTRTKSLNNFILK